MTTTRRSFLIGAAGLGFGGLALYIGMGSGGYDPTMKAGGYGPLMKDPNNIIDLPEGFSYTVLSRAGDLMSDGLLTPGDPDGMAAFPGEDGTVILIRNHELYPDQNDLSAFGDGHALLNDAHRQKMFDPGTEGYIGEGGTTTLVFDPRTKEVKRHWLSLSGTINNCAGGPTPWNSWLTCEETFLNADDDLQQDHGYIFEVKAGESPELQQAQPIKAMGKFNHEAIAVDPKTGIVYETEDRGDGLIYRYIPNQPGDLLAGGRLQALAIVQAPSMDLRNWGDGPFIPQGQNLHVAWIDLENVDSNEDDLRYRGFDAGAARFARGEGMWYGDGDIYFSCTNGGPEKYGQIWRYTPSSDEGTATEAENPGVLTLFAQPQDDRMMRQCDNITFSPRGHLIVCEDGTGSDSIRGIDPEGNIYTLAHNPYTGSEFAGACFSPDGGTLFVNMQYNQMTIAISGPWEHYSAAG